MRHYLSKMTKSKLEILSFSKCGTNIDGRMSSDVAHARLPVEVSSCRAKKQEILKYLCAARKHRLASEFDTKDQKTVENVP